MGQLGKNGEDMENVSGSFILPRKIKQAKPASNVPLPSKSGLVEFLSA